MRKRNHYGFNLYKNGEFQFVVDGDNEETAVNDMKHYVKSNHRDIAEYTYREFANHSTEGFELKQL